MIWHETPVGTTRFRTVFCWFPRKFYTHDKVDYTTTTVWLEWVCLYEKYIQYSVGRGWKIEKFKMGKIRSFSE